MIKIQTVPPNSNSPCWPGTAPGGFSLYPPQRLHGLGRSNTTEFRYSAIRIRNTLFGDCRDISPKVALRRIPEVQYPRSWDSYPVKDPLWRSSFCWKIITVKQSVCSDCSSHGDLLFSKTQFCCKLKVVIQTLLVQV